MCSSIADHNQFTVNTGLGFKEWEPVFEISEDKISIRGNLKHKKMRITYKQVQNTSIQTDIIKHLTYNIEILCSTCTESLCPPVVTLVTSIALIKENRTVVTI